MSGATREQVYVVIDKERQYQIDRWGGSPSAGLHEPGAFILFMEEYLGEARRLESTREDGNNRPDQHGEGSLDFVRKVTALGVACMEQHGAPRRGAK